MTRAEREKLEGLKEITIELSDRLENVSMQVLEECPYDLFEDVSSITEQSHSIARHIQKMLET